MELYQFEHRNIKCLLCICFRSRWPWMWDLSRIRCEGTTWRKSAWSSSRGSRRTSRQETSDGKTVSLNLLSHSGRTESRTEQHRHTQTERTNDLRTSRWAAYLDSLKDVSLQPQFVASSSTVFSFSLNDWGRMLGIRSDCWDSQRTETLYTIETQLNNMAMEAVASDHPSVAIPHEKPLLLSVI